MSKTMASFEDGSVQFKLKKVFSCKQNFLKLYFRKIRSIRIFYFDSFNQNTG